MHQTQTTVQLVDEALRATTQAGAPAAAGLKLEAWRFFTDLCSLPDVLSSTPDLVSNCTASCLFAEASAEKPAWTTLADFSYAAGPARFDGANYTSNYGAQRFNNNLRRASPENLCWL